MGFCERRKLRVLGVQQVLGHKGSHNNHKVSEASDLLNPIMVMVVMADTDMLVWDMVGTDMLLHSAIVVLLALLDTLALQLLFPTEAHKVLASKI